MNDGKLIPIIVYKRRTIVAVWSWPRSHTDSSQVARSLTYWLQTASAAHPFGIDAFIYGFCFIYCMYNVCMKKLDVIIYMLDYIRR